MNLPGLNNLTDYAVLQLSVELNSSYVTTVDELANTISAGSTASIAAFMSCFALLSVLLIAQFVVGVHRLAAKNFSMLCALASVPKSEIATMRKSADEIIIQGDDNGEGEGQALSDSDVSWSDVLIRHSTLS